MMVKILGIDKDEVLVKRVRVSEGGWVGGRGVLGVFLGLEGIWIMLLELEDWGGEICLLLLEDWLEIFFYVWEVVECWDRVVDFVGVGVGVMGLGFWKIGGIGLVEVVGWYVGLSVS